MPPREKNNMEDAGMKNRFGRVLLPFITPFDRNEDVDLKVLAQLIDRTIRMGFLDTAILTGTTGEFNVLSFDERVRVYEAAVEMVDGRCPIIAGTGCASTRETVALTKAAVALGIDTCMVVAPYYCKPNQEGIYGHYMRVAEETGANILQYNIPIFTGVNIEPSTLRRLVAESDRFIGIKDESGVNPVQIMDYRRAVSDIRPDFLFFNGDDIMLMPTMGLGVHGIVSGSALIVGDRIKRAFECYERGENKEAEALYLDVYRLCKCFCTTRTHPNPMLRAAVEMVTGLPVGPARMPLDKPASTELEVLRSLLQVLGLI
jgi:4-hydroxy-tetrahydrodipicolinate synthase